ncbi:MAG: hypothetical protein EBX72_04175, partial [Betaproteobacteria bacterium]|nr:hypothetical protein [Betaproteobacteria bacterium]
TDLDRVGQGGWWSVQASTRWALPGDRSLEIDPVLTGTRIASPVKASATAITVVLGSLIWAGFLFDWHASLIGVQPMVMTR